MNIIWLLQGSMILESGKYRLVIDPYISDYVEKHHGVTRLAQPPLSASEIRPSFIYCTHNHIDHLDPEGLPEILELYKDCPVSGPVSVVKECGKLGIRPAKLIQAEVDKPFKAGPFELIPVKAYHSDADATGLIVKAEGKTIYISGDSEYCDELPSLIMKSAGSRIDIAIICINGRLGNMNLEDAVKTVKSLGVKMAIPMHYGLFEQNTADPVPFVDACRDAGMNSFMMQPGKSIKLN